MFSLHQVIIWCGFKTYLKPVNLTLSPTGPTELCATGISRVSASVLQDGLKSPRAGLHKISTEKHPGDLSPGSTKTQNQDWIETL